MDVGRLLCVMLVAAACVGCQERVVRDDSMWSGDLATSSDARYERIDPGGPEDDDEVGAFFSDAGEFLFGWTRSLTGQEKPRSSSRTQRALEQASEVSRPSWADLAREQSE